MSDRHLQPSVNGVFAAVCVDVIHSRYQKDHQWQSDVTLVFSVDAPGRPHTLASMRFPMDLAAGSRLRTRLEEWRGMPFTEEQIDAFDIDQCVGVGATARVQSNRHPHKITVNVQRLAPLPKADTPSMPPGYVRQHHRLSA